MLVLRQLEIDGFGPFFSRAEFEFPESGVTVIYGDNMVGKTTLMNAIRYVFFGEIHGRGERTRGILSACNRDRVAAGTYDFKVLLSVTHDGRNYEIVREATPKVTAPKSDDDFTPSVSLRRGGVVLGPSERAASLRAMLPKNIARFFLFDGELLDQYAELLISESDTGRVISEAIEQILGVPVLRDARAHLKVLKSDASRAKAAEASKHQKTQALGISLKQASDTCQAHVDERDRKKKELEDLYGERDEIETELRRQDIYAVAVDRLDAARKDLRAAREVQRVKKIELKAVMAESWRTVLHGPVTTARNRAQQAVTDAFTRMQTALRVEAVHNRHCGTCDQNVSEEVCLRLAGTLPVGVSAATSFDVGGMTAMARASELDSFEHKDVRGEARLISEAIRGARLAEADAESRIADANQTLDGRDPDELRHRKTTLTEIGAKIQATSDAIKGHEDKIAEQEAAIARLSRRLASAGTPELAVFEQREWVLARSHAVFDDAVERYKSELRSRVEASATKLFLQMTTEKKDYARLAINDHYGLSIIHTDGRVEDSRSSGAEQIVALALMGALQACAPLRGPIVMDTPFGRLDPKHTANVVAALPSMADQVVLLVQEGEIDRATVRELLGRSLSKEYQLHRLTARQTIIAEAR